MTQPPPAHNLTAATTASRLTCRNRAAEQDIVSPAPLHQRLPGLSCRSGYQAQVSVFMAPANYSSLIGDYLSWSATDAVGSQQYAYARVSVGG